MTIDLYLPRLLSLMLEGFEDLKILKDSLFGVASKEGLRLNSEEKEVT